MEFIDYTTIGNDRIDLIVYKHYGSTEKLNLVLDHNPQLHKKPMSLKSGQIIKLPIVQKVTQKTTVTERMKLW